MPRKFLRSSDQWTYGYIGKYFSYKDLMSEGSDFAEDNPTNLFKILGVTLYHTVDLIPLSPKKGTYSRSQLYFVAVSFDRQQQWDVYPVKSFSSSLVETNRFYKLRERGISRDSLHLFRPPVRSTPQNTYFMEGVTDDLPICYLSARQMGVLMTFQPASSDYIYDRVILANVRKSSLFILKKLNSAISM